MGRPPSSLEILAVRSTERYRSDQRLGARVKLSIDNLGSCTSRFSDVVLYGLGWKGYQLK